MAWIDEHRAELVEQTAKSGGLVSALLNWGFVLGCFGLAAGGAYTFLAKDRAWQLGAMNEVAKLPTNADGTRNFSDVQKVIGTHFKAHMESAVAPASSGARLGTRARATFLSHCKESFGAADITSFMDPGERARIPDTPMVWEQRFMIMDTWSRLGGLVALGSAFDKTGKTGKHVGGANRAGAGAVGDFVACALARSTTTLCNGDNRAAAVLYLSAYFGMYENGAEEVKKFPPQEKAAAERELNPLRHKRIESDLEKHAKAGTITLSDVGLFGNSRVREIIGRHEAAADSCAKPN